MSLDPDLPRPPRFPVVGGPLLGSRSGGRSRLRSNVHRRRSGHGFGGPNRPRGCSTPRPPDWPTPPLGRDSALLWGVGQSLALQAGELFGADPSIQNFDVFAYRLPGENGRGVPLKA